MYGIAFCWKPWEWRLGKCDAYDDELGRVIGVWFCLGPIAFTYDYE